jgi:hypothetical protein
LERTIACRTWRSVADSVPMRLAPKLASNTAATSDIKLLRLESGKTTELAGHAVQMEKSLQQLFQDNLEAVLGVRFLASEHSTGPVHGGRIGSLGLSAVAIRVSFRCCHLRGSAHDVDTLKGTDQDRDMGLGRKLLSDSPLDMIIKAGNTFVAAHLHDRPTVLPKPRIMLSFPQCRQSPRSVARPSQTAAA